MMDDNRGKVKRRNILRPLKKSHNSIIYFINQDDASALALLKKHRVLHAAVDAYEKTVVALGERANALIGLGDAASFDTEAVKRAQENLDALYAALKALAEKRGLNLDESYKLFQLNREVSPLGRGEGER